MSPDDRMERLLIELLAEDAPSRPPDRLVPETLRALRDVRRRPRWLALMKEPPMRYPSRVVVGSPTLRLIAIAAFSLLLLLMTLSAIAAGANVLSADTVPPPFGLARNGSLVYAMDGDIYAADADGGNERVIVAGTADDIEAWFSHDGTQIAFVRQTGDDAFALMVADADGTDERQVVDRIEWAEFMPADDQMIIIRSVDDQRVMSVVDLADLTRRDLDLDGIEPFWWAYPRPPHGDEIVFVGFPVPGEPAAGIYAIGIDNTGLRPIGEISTDESARDDSSPRRWSFQDPSLSSDGDAIAFWNWEPPVDPNGDSGSYVPPGPYLHLRDLSTGVELPVPGGDGDGGLPMLHPEGNGYLPRFLPDGDGVVYEARVITDTGRSVKQLFLGSPDGSQDAVPIGDPWDVGLQHWWDVSPDGAAVLSSAGSSGASIIDLATGETAKIQGLGDAWDWQRLAP